MTSEHGEQTPEQTPDQNPDQSPEQDQDRGPDRAEEEAGNERAGGDAEAAGSTDEREAVATDDDDLFGDER